MWYDLHKVKITDLSNLLGKECLIADYQIGTGWAITYKVAVFKEDEHGDSTVILDNLYWEADQQYSIEEYPFFMVIDGPTESQLKLTQ